jgi:hypothetical protein
MNRTPVRFFSVLQRGALRRGAVFGGILLLALFAFEIFNYSTTEFALNDLLGSGLRFAGLRWSTILSLAFCGIDFAGLARLFTPEQGRDEPSEAWYLFGAWLLAAAMNATLTWWGVAVAVRTHVSLASGSVFSQQTLLKVIPVFVAVMVGVIRVLIIGTFSMAGSRIFSMAENRPSMLGNAFRSSASAQYGRTSRPDPGHSRGLPHPTRPVSVPFHPAPKPEPTYQPVGMSASPRDKEASIRR